VDVPDGLFHAFAVVSEGWEGDEVGEGRRNNEDRKEDGKDARDRETHGL
jgi:hypothetical protein